ncbi:ulp1 protease family, C-terminal catalytic domain-containing protein [Artemisia annua]|uniref:Ulp1 protease family, C-terminal catalytic domain-containing protein n=1 Tax=Artemisia annua TaxID=35608 RepID=A0A2U1NAE6_ARTAN|nr:ulp1 protease family, C-terminal catalytic domain-containing protein [Artemisia annua]
MSNKQLLKYVASMEGRLAAVEKLVKPRKVPIDVTVPAVNHPAKEPVADAEIVIELTGDVEKPKHMEEDIDKKMKGVVYEEHTVNEPMEEEVVKEPMEEEVEEDTNKKNTEEDAVDHNEKDDAEIKDIFGSPTPKDSANDLTDFNFFSSLPDDLFQDTNGSLDQQMNVGVPQDLGPVPDNLGINEVINERLDEHMGVDVTQAEKQEPALSLIPEDSLIDVDMYDGIKTVKVPFKRARKKSRHLSSPYTPPPPTTPKRSRKCRTSSRMYKSTMQKMIGPDGSEVQLEPWVEQLTGPQGSPEGVVNQHPEITLLLRSRKDMKFQLPWVNGDFSNKFWIGLVGKDRNRREGVTYGVPWTDESVEKVYFPINEPKVHWALGVLHIRSGLVTIYDSLHGPDDEGKEWWANWMEHFAAVIPPYLEEANVMATKKIDPKSYSITFTYNKEVPMQVGYYGDCGIWVMICLYRLTHNIPLMVDDAAAVAIAYREQLMAFFWKYQKVISMG